MNIGDYKCGTYILTMTLYGVDTVQDFGVLGDDDAGCD